MSFVFTLKKLGDICFYLAFANYFAAFGGAAAAVQTLPVFIICSYLSAALSKKGKLRFLPLFILPACFLIMPLNPANFFLLLPAFVYLAVSIYRINRMPASFDYSGIFKIFLAAFLPFFVIMFTIRGFYTTQGRTISHDEVVLPFAFIFVITSILLMRITRHGPEIFSQPRYILMNSLHIIALVVLGVILGSRTFIDLFGFVIRTLYFEVILPILIFLIMGLFTLLGPLFNRINPLELRLEGREAGDGYTTWEEMLDLDFSAPERLPVLRSFLILLGITLIVYFVYRALKKLLEYKEQTVSPSGHNGRFSLPPQVKPVTLKFFTNNPIRETYRKFLRICRKTGIKSQAYNTSADFETFTKMRFESPDEAALFRSLYINTRYGEKKAAGDDVRKMKKILAAFKKRKKFSY